MLTIALAGNPNSGKTSLFNALTGKHQHVGNWPGVTVEKKEGVLKGHPEVIIQDLPGIYSLSPHSPEERIAGNYLTKQKPDVIINIVDATNLERNLYLTTQLTALGIPIVLALNMMDILRKRNEKLDSAILSGKLGCPVVEISALREEGLEELTKKALSLARSNEQRKVPAILGKNLECALEFIEDKITGKAPEPLLRWYALRLFEREEGAAQELSLNVELLSGIEERIRRCEEEEDDDAVSLVSAQRYDAIAAIVGSAVKKKQKMTGECLSDKIDRIVTNRWLGFPIFALVMFVVYYLAVATIGTQMTDFTNEVVFEEWVLGWLSEAFLKWNIAPWLSGLVIEGIVAGVGAVIGFLPQMLVLFLMLAILEDIGYMARVAFIMDRMFRRFGLSGKSFIPMLIGSGCSVPGIMAARTIESQRDRHLTVLTTSFIPCSAKLPIIALIAGAVFGGAVWVAPLAYFIGLAAVIVSGIILKKTSVFMGESAPFVMELPRYHIPSWKNVLKSVWDRGGAFVRRAGTIILLSSIVLWFLQSFGFAAGRLAMVDDNNTSLLAGIGNAVAPLFSPLGFGQWKAAVAVFTGLVAKENVVSTFGVLYGFAEVAEDGAEIWSLVAADFTAVSAMSFLIFNLLCAPCFAAIGAIRSEMGTRLRALGAVGYMTVFAYAISLIVYQSGNWLQTGDFTVGTGFAAFAAALLLYFLLRRGPLRIRVSGRRLASQR